MPVIRWSTSLKPNNRPRTSYSMWKIPASLVQTYRIRDCQSMFMTVRFGEHAMTMAAETRSGQELYVVKTAADLLRDHARSVDFKGSIDFEASFSHEHEEEDIDLEYETPPDLDDAQANLEPDDVALPETTRRSLIEARVGQGTFRANVLSNWRSGCAVTGVDLSPLLRASHIKPWNLSDNRERLDVHNGLPLIATLDAAFDQYLISFEDDGSLIYDDLLGPMPWKVLGIGKSSRLRRRPTVEQCRYLAYHRAFRESVT